MSIILFVGKTHILQTQVLLILEIAIIGSILNPLAEKISEDTRKKCKGAKTGAPHDWRSFYLSQHDWLKGSHITKVVWLPNETDYSYCEFMAPNTPYYSCGKIPFSTGCSVNGERGGANQTTV